MFPRLFFLSFRFRRLEGVGGWWWWVGGLGIKSGCNVKPGYFVPDQLITFFNIQFKCKSRLPKKSKLRRWKENFLQFFCVFIMQLNENKNNKRQALCCLLFVCCFLLMDAWEGWGQLIFRQLYLFWLQWHILRRRISRQCTIIPCRHRIQSATERPIHRLEFSSLHASRRHHSSRPRIHHQYQSIGSLSVLREVRPCCGWMDKYLRISFQ